MTLTFDCPTSLATTPFPAANLPVIAPSATDKVLVVTDTGTSLVPISSLGAASGAGTPEGSVIASPGATYWDTTNKLLYVKDTGTASTGWLSLM